jgi:GNAT superfamily N-acetyltransferase
MSADEMSPRGRQAPRGAALPWWILRFGRIQGLRPALLGREDIDACRRLLFRVFHEEIGWDPPAGNSSGLRIEPATGRMVDDYDEEAVWFGAYRGATLVACCRVIPPDPRRPLEVARYTSIPAHILDGALESNRLVVQRGHRGGGTFALVVMILWWVARRLGVQRALITAEEPLSQRLYRPLGWEFTGVRFRYHPDDPHYCELLAMSPDGGRVLRSLAMTVGRAIVRRLPRGRLTSGDRRGPRAEESGP